MLSISSLRAAAVPLASGVLALTCSVALTSPAAAALARPLGPSSALSSRAATGRAPVVDTSSGPVSGIVVGDEREYLGIPYAAPPVGPLRWQPPVPHPSWSSPLAATAFGPHCPQPPSPFGQASLTEDCLYLNVFTPRGREAGRNRPVMVWFHGGAFTVGESDDYDPARLVARGVDVVTLNYRLGALGFLAHPALDSEGHPFANYGTMDQQAALQWVRRNATAFGGDPRRVTIFGESAGGGSVISQLASPKATGTFSRAIIESGAYLNTPTRTDAETAGTAYAVSEGCTTAACLRGLSVLQILTKEASGYQPITDGTILPEAPKTAIAEGHFNRVPTIDGSNRDEFRLFTALDFDLVTGPLTSTTYPLALAAEVGPVAAPLVLAEYPVANYPSADLANSAALTDATFACTAEFLDRSLAQYVLTFGYEFADETAPELFLPPVAFPYGSAHASEIQYLFNLQAPIPQSLDARQRALSQRMIGYWTSFAAYGFPFARDGSPWFPYVGAFNNVQRLQLPTDATYTGFNGEHHCNFWSGLLQPGRSNDANPRRPAVRGTFVR